MNLVLAHCGKEWRAQRGMLVAYTLLVFSCLCLGFLLAPEGWWLVEGRSPVALSFFVAAGVIGVVVFAAPHLVRSEFATKDDQFVRRLPGALGASFSGKLLFLVLCSAALPLAGLAGGELFLTAIDKPWHELFAELPDGSFAGAVASVWAWPAVVWCQALLLVTWVWAIATWLPSGRMALGGVMLLVLLLGLCVFAVLRQCPNIEQGIAWQAWLWVVPTFGTIVAGISWVAGRRGGGALRSARFGLAATLLGLLPPSLWFADRAWAYHHPDPHQVAELQAHGLSPDGRFVLASGTAHENWCHSTFRIDLQTGVAQQIAGTDAAFSPNLVRPSQPRVAGQLRYWFSYGEGATGCRVFDLATGEWTPVAYDDQNYAPVLPPDLRSQVLAEVRAATPLRAPGDRRVWFEDDELCLEEADGTVSRLPHRRDQHTNLWPLGHGFRVKDGVFDLSRRVRIEQKGVRLGLAFVVRGVLVFVPNGKSIGQWSQQDVGGEARPCEPLARSHVVGLFDDDQLLCARLQTRHGETPSLFLYRPADRTTTELVVPDGVPFETVSGDVPLHHQGSLLARDPAGRIWLRCGRSRDETFLLLDPASHAVTPVLLHSRTGSRWNQLLGWPDAHSVLVREDAQIVRIHIATGERTVLFPRR